MSRIDVENSQQIRNPMDVLITMEVPATDITLTYSGYSSAKVADGILGESTWPMRLLADLKGDGFPLDGTRVVYDPNTTASATNGKIGVRSNIGQSVSVTVTGNRTISSLSIFATGAESVTYNGTTSAIVGGQVIIPVGATSITLMFNPASTTERIEVSEISAGTALRITNDTLIKAVVSLRSDLSIIDPTLPESELNVDVYNDADISEIVASLPEDTPITYQAGYEGDMSPVRKFYVSGQVTWADNILSIHAVDAVHFLDQNIGPIGFWALNPLDQLTSPNDIIEMIVPEAARFGVEIEPELLYFGIPQFIAGSATHTTAVIPRGVTLRSFLAFASNVFKIDRIPKDYWNPNYINDYISFWVGYVDAGIPTLHSVKPEPKWAITENDCGSLTKNIDRTLAKIVTEYASAEVFNDNSPLFDGAIECGTVEWGETGVGFVKIENLVGSVMYGLAPSDIPTVTPESSNRTAIPILPATAEGGIYGVPERDAISYQYKYLRAEGQWGVASRTGEGGYQIFDSESPQNYKTSSGGVIYNQVVPPNAIFNDDSDWRWRSQQAAWQGLKAAGYISDNETTTTLKVFGSIINSEKVRQEYTPSIPTDGQAVEIECGLYGWIGARNRTTGAEMEIYPKAAYQSLFDRSPITCSFTWKGDPRIQPRDVFTFHRLDGTDEDWTFENITLTHEKGGTVAEITARKGIV